MENAEEYRALRHESDRLLEALGVPRVKDGRELSTVERLKLAQDGQAEMYQRKLIGNMERIIRDSNYDILVCNGLSRDIAELRYMQEKCPGSDGRIRALAITKLEEARHWLREIPAVMEWLDSLTRSKIMNEISPQGGDMTQGQDSGDIMTPGGGR
jgi:hypothetical protein